MRCPADLSNTILNLAERADKKCDFPAAYQMKHQIILAAFSPDT
ncbi:MAG: hypothetical protein ACI8W3_003670 [Myxococcota bacterium]|jgi:hypothetical protein